MCPTEMERLGQELRAAKEDNQTLQLQVCRQKHATTSQSRLTSYETVCCRPISRSSYSWSCSMSRTL